MTNTNKKKTTWNVVGTFTICGKEEECLCYACGTEEHAKEVAYRMNNNPNENDMYSINKGGHNFRPHEEEVENCWWMD